MPQVIYEDGEPRWNDIDRKKPNNLGGGTCPSDTLSITIPTWTDPGLRDERPATNRISLTGSIKHTASP
jgi:hypothetical protein